MTRTIRMLGLRTNNCFMVIATLLALIVILAIYSLTVNAIYGFSLSTNSPQTVAIEMNPWNANIQTAVIKSRQTHVVSSTGKHISLLNSKHSDRDIVYNRQSTFTFLQGINNIKHEYNKAISTLSPIHIDDGPKNAKCNHKGRVFALGLMKTGTTSMTKALHMLGYTCSEASCKHQGNWFHFIDSVHLWQPLEVIVLSLMNMTDLFEDTYITESKQGLAYGDSPWCFMYEIWDKLYPNSKYILMTRKDSKTYITSYLTYLKKYKKAYVSKGLKHAEFSLIALRRYDMHNARVRQYFKDRPDDLLEVVLEEMHDEQGWNKIVDFLGCDTPHRKFPHMNKSNRKSKRNKRAPRVQINLDISDQGWNWTKRFGEFIPYLVRDEKDQSHSLKVVHKNEFVMDWNSFVVDGLKVNV